MNKRQVVFVPVLWWLREETLWCGRTSLDVRFLWVQWGAGNDHPSEAAQECHLTLDPLLPLVPAT